MESHWLFTIQDIQGEENTREMLDNMKEVGFGWVSRKQIGVFDMCLICLIEFTTFTAISQNSQRQIRMILG